MNQVHMRQVEAWIRLTERQINHRRKDLRDDLVQVGWEAALKADQTHDEDLGYSYKSWIIQHLRRDMMRYLKQEMKHMTQHEDIDELKDLDGIEELLDFDEQERMTHKVDVTELVGILPEREAIVVELYYFRDLSETEIGERLGVSRSMIQKIHKRALEKMSEQGGINLPEASAIYT